MVIFQTLCICDIPPHTSFWSYTRRRKGLPREELTFLTVDVWQLSLYSHPVVHHVAWCIIVDHSNSIGGLG